MNRVLPLFVLIAAGCGGWTPTPPTEPERPDLDYPVGSFKLTERSGKTITDQDLRGHVWIASYIFTRCTGTCPAVTNTMARLQRDLREELQSSKLKLVTFTVDPERDDLKSLNEYASSRQADPNHWYFLTGDEQVIHSLLKEQFKQVVARKLGPEVKVGDEFDHGTRIILVDKHGIIRATYEGLPDENMPDGNERFEQGLQHLKERARELMK